MGRPNGCPIGCSIGHPVGRPSGRPIPESADAKIAPTPSEDDDGTMPTWEGAAAGEQEDGPVLSGVRRIQTGLGQGRTRGP